jgi:hypothetical protein
MGWTASSDSDRIKHRHAIAAGAPRKRALSAYVPQQVGPEAERVFDCYLGKPVDPQQVYDTLSH